MPNYTTKLSPEDLEAIRQRNREIIQRYVAGERKVALARAFKLSETRVGRIVKEAEHD